MKKKWRIQTPDSQIVRQLCEALKCHPITATVLTNRNLADVSNAYAFFNTSLKDLRPPFAIKDMDRAVERIHTALVEKEKILIFGDYDVDGITATVLFFEFLQAAGAQVDYYIPHRIIEGYGLRECHIRDHVEPNRYDLLITVDCGIGSHEAVAAANRAKIDVIITDHHQVPETLPEAFAVINPKRADCDAGFAPLAGVGVVYVVLICLRKYLRDQGFWAETAEPNLKTACDLVALGTVADIVPLIRENRILTQIGIDALNSGQRPGIQALLEAAGVSGPLVNGEDISFRLAPRLNAAGRIGHANSAIELLTTRDTEKAAHLADALNKMNAERRSIEQAMLKQIREQLLTYPNLNRTPALVLSDPHWHEGVLGIVAAKLVERYYRPVILISTRNGTGKGSARSIPGFNLHEGLLKAASCLESFGGHAAAAGLSIKKENIARFTSLFESIVKENTRPEAFTPIVTIDQEIRFDQISPQLADELEQLQPFGEGNPEPLFSARNIRISYSQMIGGAHRRMRLMQPGTQSSQALHAIQFNVAPTHTDTEHLDQIAFRLRWNRWNGKKTLQLLIEEAE
jgi:single-stranded-DNA-specific exonuclease